FVVPAGYWLYPVERNRLTREALSRRLPHPTCPPSTACGGSVCRPIRGYLEERAVSSKLDCFRPTVATHGMSVDAVRRAIKAGKLQAEKISPRKTLVLLPRRS